MSEQAKVTRAHRERAFVALYGEGTLLYSQSGREWIETGDERCNPPWPKVAQALANLEAAARADEGRKAWDAGWMANEISSGDLSDWARERKERNPYPEPTR